MSENSFLEKLQQFKIPDWYIPANNIVSKSEFRELLIKASKHEKVKIHELKSKINAKLWDKYKSKFDKQFSNATYIPALDYTMFMFEIILPILEPVFKAFDLELNLDKQNKTLIVTTPYFARKPVKENIKLVLRHQPNQKTQKSRNKIYYQWNLYYHAYSQKNSIANFSIDFNTLIIAPKPEIPVDLIKPWFMRDIDIFTHELIHLIFELVNWKTPLFIRQQFSGHPNKMFTLLVIFDVFNEALAYTYEYLALLIIAQEFLTEPELAEFIILDQVWVLVHKTLFLLDERVGRDKKLKNTQKLLQNPLETVKSSTKLYEVYKTGVFYTLFDEREILASPWGGTALSYYLMIHKQNKDWWYFDKNGNFDLQLAINQLKKHILDLRNNPNYLEQFENIVKLVYGVL